MIYETVPMLESLEASMHKIRDDAKHELRPVFRVAAHAALILIGKYYALTDDNEAYRIAMCE